MSMVIELTLFAIHLVLNSVTLITPVHDAITIIDYISDL